MCAAGYKFVPGDYEVLLEDYMICTSMGARHTQRVRVCCLGFGENGVVRRANRESNHEAVVYWGSPIWCAGARSYAKLTGLYHKASIST